MPLLGPDGHPLPSSLRPREIAPRSFSPFWATQESPARQWLWTFAEDTRRELSPYSRSVMMLKSRTLFANSDIPAVLENLAGLVGSLRPQCRSGDKAFDERAEQAFDYVMGSPLIADAGGRWTFDTVQPLLTLRRFLDGDVFTVLTESTQGRARFAVREGHCVVSPSGADATWNDGVKTDANGFPLGYGFRSQTAKDKVSILPLSAVHHMGQWTNEGATRGTPTGSRWVNNVQDLLETMAHTKLGIKIAAAMGIMPKDARPNGAAAAAVASALDEEFYQTAAEARSGASTASMAVNMESILRGGMVADAPYEVLADDRPGPNSMEFRREILRMMSIGLGVPPDFLFYCDDRGGAQNRVDLDIFAKFVMKEYARHLIPFGQRLWTYTIAKEIKAERLAPPSGDAQFWRVKWCAPRSLRADAGRLGRLAIEARKHLLTTYQRELEEMGLDWMDELSQASTELKYLRELEERDGHAPGTLTNCLTLWPNAPAPVEELDPAPAPAKKKAA